MYIYMYIHICIYIYIHHIEEVAGSIILASCCTLPRTCHYQLETSAGEGPISRQDYPQAGNPVSSHLWTSCFK